MNDFTVYLVDERKLSAQTAKFYNADIDSFQTFLKDHRTPSWWAGGIKPVQAATQEDIQAYVDYLIGRNYKPASINRKISTLSTYYRFLVKRGLLKSSPIAHESRRGGGLNIRKPKAVKSEIKYLSPEDIQRLIDSISTPTELFTLRDKALYLIMFKTGLRSPELQSIRMGDVNFTTQEVTYTPHRGRARKTVALTPDIESAMEAYYFARLRAEPAIGDESPLFANKNGTTLSTRSIRRNLDKHAEKVNLIVNPSQLRHSFAMAELQQGHSVEDVQERLGHINLASTQIYINQLPETKDLGPAAPVEEVEIIHVPQLVGV